MNQEVRVGQYNLPTWKDMEKMIDGIYNRKYYTNHGPLLQKLEDDLCRMLDVRHAICMTNRDIATMISLLALEVKGDVIIPAFSPVGLSQNILWADLHPVICDFSGHPNLQVKDVEEKINNNSRVLVVIHNWGDACDIEVFEELAERYSLKLIFWSEDVYGQKFKGKLHGGNGDLEIFSFHEKTIVNAGDGACVTTNDCDLAARIRNIRSSYGARHKVDIPYTGNGRMSEIQAGMILESLKNLKSNIARNRRLIDIYQKEISLIDGVGLFTPGDQNTDLSYSRAILELNKKNSLSDNDLKSRLKKFKISASNFVTYGLDPIRLEVIPSEGILKAKERYLELPLGRLTDEGMILQICQLLKSAD